MPTQSLKLPSASKLGLGMKCLGSFMLPQVKSIDAGPEAEEGKRIHAVLEKYINAGRSEEEIEGDDLDLCRRVGRTIGPASVNVGERSELGLLVATEPDRKSNQTRLVVRGEIPSDAIRGYSIYCIVDLLRILDEQHVEVWDFKTGNSYVPEPEWNWQLIAPAIGAWDLAGRPSEFCATGIIAYVRESSYDGDRGVYATERYDYSSEFLSGRSEYISAMAKRARSSDPSTATLYEGKHCQYCPARSRCPAKVGAVGQAMLVASEIDSETRIWVDDFDIVKASMLLLDSKPQIDKAAKEVLRNNNNVIDLGDGREAVLAVDKRGKEKVFTRKKQGAG